MTCVRKTFAVFQPRSSSHMEGLHVFQVIILGNVTGSLALGPRQVAESLKRGGKLIFAFLPVLRLVIGETKLSEAVNHMKQLC